MKMKTNKFLIFKNINVYFFKLIKQVNAKSFQTKKQHFTLNCSDYTSIYIYIKIYLKQQ